MVRWAVSLALIASASSAGAEQWDKPPAFNAKVQAVVEAAIGARLKDTESAKWRWPLQPKTDHTVVEYCGWLNAKNSYGGYTGFEPFWATGYWKAGKFSLITVEADDPPIAASMCRAAGIDLGPRD